MPAAEPGNVQQRVKELCQAPLRGSSDLEGIAPGVSTNVRLEVCAYSARITMGFSLTVPPVCGRRLTNIGGETDTSRAACSAAIQARQTHSLADFHCCFSDGCLSCLYPKMQLVIFLLADLLEDGLCAGPDGIGHRRFGYNGLPVCCRILVL